MAAQDASEDTFFGMLADTTSDHNALGVVISEFLEARGGREANGLDGTEDISLLVPKLLARYDLDEQAMQEEVTKAHGLVAQTTGQLATQGEVLAFESKRADEAERKLAEMTAKYEALQAGTTRELAQRDTEIAMLHSISAEHMLENTIDRQRREMVRPVLEHMLDAPSHPGEDQMAASLLEGLGIMDRDGVLQHCESIAMHKEELAQRTSQAMQLASAAGFSGGGGGGGKGSPAKKGGGSPKKTKGKKKK